MKWCSGNLLCLFFKFKINFLTTNLNNDQVGVLWRSCCQLSNVMKYLVMAIAIKLKAPNQTWLLPNLQIELLSVEGSGEFFMNEEYELISFWVNAGFREALAVWKWRWLTRVAADISSLRATMAASLHRPSSSAPVKSSVCWAICQRSTSFPNFMFLVWTRRISWRPSKSGGGT